MNRNQSTRPLRIGLTGGIGSGKTTVCNFFHDLGIDIIDADIAAREVVRPDQPAWKDIVEHFGLDILDKNHEIDRRKLRQLVFNQTDRLRQLEKITHPRIISTMREHAKHSKSPYCILCFPLLFEKKLEDEVDRILVIDLPEDIQKHRVSQRDQVSHKHVEAIMDQQLIREERLKRADDVITNTGSITDLKTQVKKLHEKYLTMAGQD